jgi:quinol monooxygenase YgiN
LLTGWTESQLSLLINPSPWSVLRDLLYERFVSREHWQAHFEHPAILRLKAELADKVELPVERLEAYPAE